MTATVLISVTDKRWKKAVPEYTKLINSALKTVANNIPEFSGEVSVLLTNDNEIQKLNFQFRAKDKPTNVLSFPQDEPGLLGDIALSLDTLEREATSENKSLADHFTHLLIHGSLHLIGYDHQNDAEQNNMETVEIKLLSQLGTKNPY